MFLMIYFLKLSSQKWECIKVLLLNVRFLPLPSLCAASVYNCDLLPAQTWAGGVLAAILLTTFFHLSCRSIFCSQCHLFVCAGVQDAQTALDLLELELEAIESQQVVSFLMWMLRTGSRSSLRTVSWSGEMVQC